jgi:integrase/recombinase XerD
MSLMFATRSRQPEICLPDVVISRSSITWITSGGTMHVQWVAMPALRTGSWTVLGAGDVPVEPVERFLAYLTDIERSPNTVKAYAHDLKDYWMFLAHRGLDWREVRLEDIGEFVAWLRLPPAGRDGAVAVLPSAGPHVGVATINRKLAALAAFISIRCGMAWMSGSC